MMIRSSIAIFLLLAAVPLAPAQPARAKKPNVLLIITDDQGHGDLGFHGNPLIRTPNLDKFAKQSVRMKNFYVSPVCSPTRASLLTGRYNYRTGVVDTFIGRSMMHTDEITLAEMLRSIGYRTGIFGKWHLGDCYPLRAIDQGFDEALVLKGGGIGQPSDPPGGESYFNPVLQHNGKAVKKEGYCSDIFTDALIDFVTKNRAGPFFGYLAFNCPHTPLEVPKKYHDMYRDKIKVADFPRAGQPIEGKVDVDATAKIYGMITNIDDNLGRLFAKLDELGIANDTIVIFLTDNGPQQPRFNSGMRGRKGTVFEGGTRVPFFVRWPAAFPGDRDLDRIAAHIDVTPSLAAACGAELPKDRVIDGRNLLPLWLATPTPWPDRSLFFQWHRGDVPEMYRACAVRTQRWRLVQPDGVQEKSKFDGARWLLFDIENDPYETKDLAAANPEVVKNLKKDYESWFKSVAATRKFAHPRIVVGSPRELVTTLTRQDWRGPAAGWTPKSIGHWDLQVEQAGTFDVTVTLPAAAAKGARLVLKLDSRDLGGEVPEGITMPTVRAVTLPAGPARLEAWVAEKGVTRGVRFVEVRKVQ